MPALLALLLPALAPVGIGLLKDLGSSLLGWVFGDKGAQPKSVEEAVQLMQAEAAKAEAMAKLDTVAGAPSQWVVDLRAATRYLLAILILLTTSIVIGGYTFAPQLQTDGVGALVDVLLQLSGSVFSFMFGDRVYLSLRGKK